MLNYNDFHKLNINSSVNKDMTKTFVYGSEVPMETHGIVSIPVVYNAKTFKLDFTVPKHGGPSLLGKTTLLQLGIIRFLHRLETNLSGERHDNEPIQDILDPFDSLFHGIGKCNTTQIKLHIDNVAPVIQKHRRVPYHIRDKVEEELHTLLANDIIERIPEQQPTTWISPIVVVPKRDDSSGIRICVDMTLANQVIARERHPSPTIDDVIDDLKGATIFSRLDLLKGYHQFELEQESRHITTFSTHMGCFRYKRLSFGITSASEIFQHELSKIISGISGAMNISDDILIYGKNANEHDKSLKEVLKKLQSSGLTLNRSKCSFRQSELKFMGLVFTSHGVKTDEAKVKAILEMTNPTNVKDLRSLLGMVNFSSRFLPDLATVTKPLRELTKKGAKWLWTNIHQKSLDNIKQLMSRAKSLAYFDKNKSSVIWTDAGPRGLGAILTQTDDKGQQYIIAYASHSLNQTEMRYSQIEKEALAIVWSIKYFHMYLFGHAFKVVTDHRPLLSIFNKPNMVLSPRIERWKFKLQSYDFEVFYEPGKYNPADYISRHPIADNLDVNKNSRSISESYTNFVIECATPLRMSLEEIINHPKQDKVIQNVIDNIFTNTWNKTKELDPYRKIKYELSTNKDRSILLRGARIVIPKSLQNKIVKVAHSSHQGIVRTKSMLRDKVWFPGMDNMTEGLIKRCIECQSTIEQKEKPQLNVSVVPDEPWSVLNIDHKGPLATGEYLLVVIDQFSKFPVVEVVTSTASRQNIQKLDTIFSTFGIPKQIITDNGTPFQSKDFNDFVRRLGITHRKITPYWPRANGSVERFNETLSKILKIANQRSPEWKQQMNELLYDYRNTRHSVTKVTPASIILGYTTNHKIPDAGQLVASNDIEDIKERCKDAGVKTCLRYEQDNRIIKQLPKLGVKVLVRQDLKRKSEPFYDTEPYMVTDVKGSMITASRAGRSVTRNASFYKILPSESPKMLKEVKKEADPIKQEETETDTEQVEDSAEPVAKSETRYELRDNIQKTRRLIEEM